MHTLVKVSSPRLRPALRRHRRLDDRPRAPSRAFSAACCDQAPRAHGWRWPWRARRRCWKGRTRDEQAEDACPEARPRPTRSAPKNMYAISMETNTTAVAMQVVRAVEHDVGRREHVEQVEHRDREAEGERRAPRRTCARTRRTRRRPTCDRPDQRSRKNKMDAPVMREREVHEEAGTSRSRSSSAAG